MRFEWNWIRDFIINYLIIKVLLLTIIYAGTIFGIIYLFIEYISKNNLSTNQWESVIVAVFLGSFILRLLIVYYGIAERLLPGERIEKYLVNIAELREECVNNMVNYQGPMQTEEDLRELKDKFDKWHMKLIPEIEKVSPSQATIFKVLGTFNLDVPIGGFNTLFEAKEAHLNGIIREYTNRLKEMVDRFSLENMSNRVAK